MHIVIYGAALCAGLACAAAAQAQNTPETKPESEAEIVVTGNRNIENELQDFVGALTLGASDRQLARFERKICPTAIGLSPAQKQAVAERITQIAKAANIAVGKAKCTPNLLVVVTPDKAVFIEAMYKKFPNYFGDLSGGAVRRMARAPGPAAAWHVEGPKVSADDIEMSDGSDEVYVNRTTRAGSRIVSAVRPQFAAAAVIVETGALRGLTTIQLADYAAMRTLAKADPARLPGTAPTILKVLEIPMGEEVPITLTAWDLSFLRSFYAAPANLSAGAQRATIRQGVKTQLEAGQKGQ
jgi:hypothetical protein